MKRCCILCLLGLLLFSLSACATGGGYSKAELDTMISRMVLAGFRGLTPEQSADAISEVKQGQGAVIIFDRDVALGLDVRNVQSPEQVRTLMTAFQDAAPFPLLTAVDQEGGKVMRLKPKYGFPDAPSAQALGDADSIAGTRQAGLNTGNTLASVGLNVNFAPVVDVNVNPDNPAIGKLERSFSSDPEKVADHALAFIDGMHEAGVLSCIKHFPGHGSTWNDSHHGMADVTDTWTEAELIPYKRIIASGKCDMIMTAHVFNANLDPVYPATLSKKIITGLLREELGWNGIVVTDDMQMKAVVSFYGLEEAVTLAINAGVDILLFGNNLDYEPDIREQVCEIVREKIRLGVIPVSRIEESYGRILELEGRLRE